MKRTVSIFLMLFLALSLFGIVDQTYAKGPKDQRETVTSLRKVNDGTNTTDRTLVNIGQVAMWIWANGKSANDPHQDSGLIYPRGSNPTTAAIYEDGFIWGGLVYDGADPVMRVNGQAYRQGTVPGAITAPGQRENTDDNLRVNRIWRVRRDFATATDDELRQDAAEFFQKRAADVTADEIQKIRDIYRQDWMDWPAWKGAPFYDADGDGQYNPQFNEDGTPKLYPEADEPGYANGDQVVWLVCNDLSEGASFGFAGCPPIGIELQVTLWAYRRADALGQVIFKQFRYIYKGTASTPPSAYIDSMYVMQWSDPDVGEFGDDFVGCDTTLSLGFAYNSTSVDAIYSQAGYPPPASGYDFFAGPLVPSPGDVGVFGLKYKQDHKNLPMTTFGFFAAGGTDSDPAQGNYDGAQHYWNLFRGYRPRPIAPPERWKDPDGNPTMFRVPGDPVKGTGWIDGQMDAPGDRRMLMASGPFTLALGDTNETVVATIVGMGSDRLSSISVLKFYDRAAQEAFDNLFELAQAPPPPPLTATEMDGEVLLDWGSNQAGVDAVEKFNSKGFVFEGYNVYQLPSPGATAEAGKLLATYDVINEVTVISQETFDPKSGLILELPVQQGTNSGIKRTLTVNWDYLRDKPLANGRTYYFGVEAYSFNPDPDATLKTLSSPLAVVTVVPQTLKPGVRLNADFGQVIGIPDSTVTHQGNSDGSVTVIVTDPTRVTGHDYQVTFTKDENGNDYWHLTDLTTGEVVLKNQTNQSGDENYLAVDGIQVIVRGAPNDFLDFQTVANAAGPLDPPVGAAADWYGFPGLGRPSGNQQVGGGRWLIHTGESADHNRGPYETFVDRVTQGGSRWPRIIPHDWEIRFTEQGGKALIPAAFGFPSNQLIDVPFELWNVGVLSDPNDDVRYFPYIFDVDENGQFNLLDQPTLDALPWGDVADHSVSSANNDPYTDWFYWVIPEDDSPGEAGYNALVNLIESDPAGYQYMQGAQGDAIRRMVFVEWNGGDVATGQYTMDMPETGTIFRILTTKPNTPEDVFTFSTKGFEPTVTTDAMKEDVEKINVFPNPYYGFHKAEQDRYIRYVTFNHLPQKAIIRIFTLSGTLIRTIEKDDPSQFARWDLNNSQNLPAASGMYIIHIEMPDLGKEKILKLALVREQQFLGHY